MKLFKKQGIIFFVLLIVVIGTFLFVFNPLDFFLAPRQKSFEPEQKTENSIVEMHPVSPANPIAPVSAETNPVPKEVKAVYATSWSAGRNSYVDYLVRLAKNTEINSVVIDIKDWSGYVGYNAQVPEVAKYNAETVRIKDIGALIQKLHENGIYAIARIAVFQDPILARNRPDLAVQSKSNATSFFSNRFLSSLVSSFPMAFLWLDRKGLAWIDPATKESWDYNISIAKDAINQGFDEINFDYVRFPSDGDLKNMAFPVWDGTTPKHLIIREFFKYLREQMPDAKLSIDLFGLSCSSADDLGIGQVIEDAFGYFDYISPMVYPSHYAHGFLGFQNPAEYPYQVINYSIKTASQRLLTFSQSQTTNAKIRPWLQDFNLGAIYEGSMVKAEIQAVHDATGDNFNGFMLWNASNFYTEAALQPEIQ